MKLAPFTASLLVSLSLALAGCGAAAGGGTPDPNAALEEREPNNNVAAAKALPVGRYAHGRAGNPADVDYWSLDLTAGEVISIEVFGSRLDQADWNIGPNSPRMTLLDVDGTSELRAQGGDSFDWGTDQDTDVLAFPVPATGTYSLRLAVDNAIASGGEYLVMVRDTSFTAPVQLELEPAGLSGANDSDLTAEPIVPGTLLGQYVDDEQDWYSFTLSEASVVHLTLTAHRNGIFQGDDDVYDPTLVLLDSALTQLDSNDDAFYLDSAIRYLVVTPGTYFVEVTECCGTGDSAYALDFELEPLSGLTQVSEVEPNDAVGAGQAVGFDELVQGNVVPGNPDYFVVACNAGDRLWVEIYDIDTYASALSSIDVLVRDDLGTVLPSDTGGELRTLRTVLPTSGDFYVRVASNITTDYALRVHQVGAGHESEPNDSPASAEVLDGNGRRSGAIETLGDVDVFAFEATRHVPIVFVCFADDVPPNGFFELNGFGSSLGPVLRVLDSAGTELNRVASSPGTALGTNDGMPSLSLAFMPPSTGTYYLEVSDEFGNFGSDFGYVLEQR